MLAWRPKENMMRVLKFIFSVMQPFRSYLCGMMLVVLITSIDANLRPYLVKLLIDNVADDNLNYLWILAGMYGIAQILMVLNWTFSDWCIMRFYANFRVNITTTLAYKVSQYSYTFFQNNLAGSIVSKINDAFSSVPSIWFIANYQFVSFGLSTIITLVLLVKIHLLFATGLLLWIIVFLTVTYLGMKRVIPLTKDMAESRSVIWGHLSDFITNMLGVRLFAATKFEMDRINTQSQDFIKKAQKHGRFLMNFYAIEGVISSVYTFSFLFLLIYLKKSNLISAGDFALVFMLNLSIADKLFELSHQLRDFISYWGTVDQALAILDAAPEIQDTDNAKILKADKGEISFRNVCFHYKNTAPLFADISTTISAGQKVGLVGYSGSGKTTFINLILRLYDIKSGEILIDNQVISKVTLDSLRENIGMIPQDPSLFHRSLAENIRYGKPSASDAEVIDAAKRAHAHEFIEKLPEKYESLVGEKGVKLSGGQRQRIAIARAILKNAPILILDEATSQLDSLTENYIQDSMWELMQDKTAIIIAHRLSTLLHMDRILVFDKGSIIEDGTHDELLARGGLYKTLWITQVAGFIPESR
jgi:ATP-binding cassette subfamily B protein